MNTVNRCVRYLLLECLFCVSVTTLAVSHLPDSIMVQEIGGPQVIDTGVNVFWDFANIKSIGRPSYARISSPTAEQYDCHFGQAHLLFDNVQDTIHLLGFENSLCRIKLAAPEPWYHVPFVYADSLCSQSCVVGDYGHTLPLRSYCHSTSRVEGFGRLTLPEASYDSVACVHVSRKISRSLADSPFLYNNVYIWFLSNDAQPILMYETYADSSRIIKSSTYMLGHPDMARVDIQEDDSVEVNRSSDAIISDATFSPNPCVSSLQISYMLGQSASVYFSVHYDNGLLAYRTPVAFESAGSHVASLDVSALPSASYVVYIHAADAVCSGVVIKL